MISVCFQSKSFSITVFRLYAPVSNAEEVEWFYKSYKTFSRIISGSWWWTGRPGVLQSMGSQRVGHDWATELNWLTRTSRTNTQKRCSFHYRGLQCKSKKSRNTWSNRQIWPWNMEWSRAKANRVLQRECTGHSKHPLPITQEKTLHMDITRWSTPKSDWLYSL